MASRIPQALKRVFSAIALASLLALITMTSRLQVNGQTREGTVRISPAISTAPLQSGAFEVYVVLENLQHNGTITYDDNGDGTPDRSVVSTGMAAFEFTMQFDPKVIAIDAAEPGPDLDRGGRAFQCLPPRRDQPDKFSFGCVSVGEQAPGVQGSLTLATVTIRPLQRGSSPLLLDAGLAGPLGDDIPLQTVAAVVRATGSGVAPTGSPTASATPGAVTEAPAPSQTAAVVRTVSVTAAPGLTPNTPQTSKSPQAPNDGTPGTKKGAWRPGIGFWLVMLGGGLAVGGSAVATTVLLRRKH